MISFVDTYVKLTLLNSMGQEMSKCKTSIRRGQPNPVYKETFVFQVALFQLSDVTLILSVYNKRSMKRKEMIGWISLGLNSSGEDELNHWTEMKESKGRQVCRWHTLLESWQAVQSAGVVLREFGLSRRWSSPVTIDRFVVEVKKENWGQHSIIKNTQHAKWRSLIYNHLVSGTPWCQRSLAVHRYISDPSPIHLML